MNSTKKRTSKVAKTHLGVGLAASVAAAALGAYFLYGSKHAEKNRAKVKGWTLKAQSEVLTHMKRMKQVSEADYQAIVSRVIAQYRGAKNVTGPELLALASDLRRHWKAIKPKFLHSTSRSRRAKKTSRSMPKTQSRRAKSRKK
jgi:hypothetical protein